MNYFNYFTEIEDHFQQARGTGLFLLSPLDWALIETWKQAGLPLSAVHKGIDRAFEKWHSRKRKTRMVNSLAYCAQEVLGAAREMADVDEETAPRTRPPAIRPAELAEYFRRNAATLRALSAKTPPEAVKTYDETAASLDQLAVGAEQAEHLDLQIIEQRLTVLEERLIAAALQRLSEEEMLQARQEMERQLAPYRRTMTPEQIQSLEKQYLVRQCLETSGIPRLSLFYL